tara:strand:- start:554 stop:859 length:306 start_codon:yes stop_codon:yes gene_type:complete
MRFLVNWKTPNNGSDPSYQRAVVKYLEEGKKMDKFEGFEVLARVINPHSGGGTFIVESDDISKVYRHTGPWIQSFYCDVEVTPVLSDEDYAQAAKNLLSQS